MRFHRPFIFALLCLICISTAGAQDAHPPSPRTNFIFNSTFEAGVSPWTVTNAIGDKVKCGGVGHGSDCAFMFKGGLNEATKLGQPESNVGSPIHGLVYYLDVSAYVRRVSGQTKLKFAATVNLLGDLLPVKAKYTHTASAPSSEYELVTFQVGVFFGEHYESFTLNIRNLSKSGKTYIDDIYVYDIGVRR